MFIHILFQNNNREIRKQLFKNIYIWLYIWIVSTCFTIQSLGIKYPCIHFIKYMSVWTEWIWTYRRLFLWLRCVTLEPYSVFINVMIKTGLKKIHHVIVLYYHTLADFKKQTVINISSTSSTNTALVMWCFTSTDCAGV